MDIFIDQIKKGQINLGKSSANEINLIFSGDYCPVGRADITASGNNQENLFNDLIPVIRSCDISVTNLLPHLS